MRKILLLLCCLALNAVAQNSAYEAYIAQYAAMAVEQMREYKIPASITLAQGLLESGAGKSYLARKANNHFGIKVGGSWKGPYVLRTDDAPNEKFRAYKSARESYIDHSKFLAQQKRYARLFELKLTDYKGWAHGLKACGYATSPSYAKSLIQIIETYRLYEYDTGKAKAKAKVAEAKPKRHKREKVTFPEIYFCNGAAYVVARVGDTYETLAKASGKRASRLRKWNDVAEDAILEPCEIVFLEKKPASVASSLTYSTHTLGTDESLHSVAQRYGVRLSTLLRLNKKFRPEVGAVVRLR